MSPAWHFLLNLSLILLYMKNNASTIRQEKPNLTVVRKEDSKNNSASPKLVPVKKSAEQPKILLPNQPEKYIKAKKHDFLWCVSNATSVLRHKVKLRRNVLTAVNSNVQFSQSSFYTFLKFCSVFSPGFGCWSGQHVLSLVIVEEKTNCRIFLLSWKPLTKTNNQTRIHDLKQWPEFNVQLSASP